MEKNIVIFLIAALIFSVGGLVGSSTSNKDAVLKDSICKNMGAVRADDLCVKDKTVVFTFPKD